MGERHALWPARRSAGMEKQREVVAAGIPQMQRDNCGTPLTTTAPDFDLRWPYRQVTTSRGLYNRGIAPSRNNRTRLYIFKENSQLIGFVGGVQRRRYQPGPSDRQKHDEEFLQAVGQDHRDAVAGTESGASQLLGQSLNLFGQRSVGEYDRGGLWSQGWCCAIERSDFSPEAVAFEWARMPGRCASDDFAERVPCPITSAIKMPTR